MIKAHVSQNWQMDGFDVWLFERDARSTRLLRFNAEGRPTWDEVAENVEVTPSLVIPRDAIEALLTATKDHVPATDATVDAMRDARATRDRLLAMVEKRGIR